MLDGAIVRLIQTVPHIARESSGPAYSVVRLCESLIEEGHEVTLATLKWGDINNKLPFLRTFSPGLGPQRLGHAPSMKRWLDEQALSMKISIIHANGMWQLNTAYPVWAAGKSKTKCIAAPRGALSKLAMERGSYVKRMYWPIIQRPVLSRVDCFHATARAEHEDIRRLGFHQ